MAAAGGLQFASSVQPLPPAAVWNAISASRSVSTFTILTVIAMVSSTLASVEPVASTPSLTVTVREYASSVPSVRVAPEPV